MEFKKKRKSELSNEEKRHNTKHLKLRVIVEHTVSRIKKFGIMGTKFRNRLANYKHIVNMIQCHIYYNKIIYESYKVGYLL